MKILFVCSSNICRSPFAELYFRRIAQGDAVLSKHIEWVKSGAVLNQSFKIHPKALRTLVSEGFSREEVLLHKPRFWLFAISRFAEADVIIGMGNAHRALLPFWWHKKYVSLSVAATGEYASIPDPFLIADQGRYDEAMTPIKAYLEQYAARLKEEFSSEGEKVEA